MYLRRRFKRLRTVVSSQRAKLLRGGHTGLNGLDERLEKYVDFDGGFFIEAGANDGWHQSNTYYLEKQRGWSGLLIEPIPELADACRRRRPDSTTVNCALVSDAFEGDSISMRFAGLMSLVDGAQGNPESERSHIETGLEVQGLAASYCLDVPARTLSSVLDIARRTGTIDLLSLDVEGYELNALQGLDLRRHRPRFMLVECRFETDVVNFLEGHDYATVARLSNHDLLFRDRLDQLTKGQLGLGRSRPGQSPH